MTEDAPKPLGRLDEIMPEVYEELRDLAAASMRNERADHTLQPSAVVNEVYLRLGKDRQALWDSRAHFFAAATRSIRRILIEHARGRNAVKRAGTWKRMTLEDDAALTDGSGIEILEFESALSTLEAQDERLGRVVQLRVYGGLTMQEVADVTGLSKRSIENDWALARAWMWRELGPDGDDQ